MLNKDILNVVEKLADTLKKEDISWMLIGSCNLAMQGMDLTPRDIDICVNLKDFDKVKELFSSYDKFEFEQSPSKFGGILFKINFFMDNLEVEFMGEENQSIYSEFLINKDFIKKESLYLNKLENEYNAYVKMNRIEKATKIREYLDSLTSA